MIRFLPLLYVFFITFTLFNLFPESSMQHYDVTYTVIRNVNRRHLLWSASIAGGSHFVCHSSMTCGDSGEKDQDLSFLDVSLFNSNTFRPRSVTQPLKPGPRVTGLHVPLNYSTLSTHQHFLWYSSVRRVRPFQLKHSWSTRYTQYWLSTHDLYCFDECTRYFGSTSFIVFTQPHENLLNYSTPTITLAKVYYISAF